MAPRRLILLFFSVYCALAKEAFPQPLEAQRIPRRHLLQAFEGQSSEKNASKIENELSEIDEVASNPHFQATAATMQLHEPLNTTEAEEIRANGTQRSSTTTSAADAEYKILAVVSAYRDDISWLLKYDNGGDNWAWRVPTLLYQVSDIDQDCRPTFPGFEKFKNEVYPQPSWPAWAAKWAYEKCQIIKNEGISPGSISDAERAAKIQAGLLQPTPAENLNSTAWKEISGSGIIHFPKLTPLPMYLVPNRASEVLSYLDAIISNYEQLPSLMLFMHGHRSSWHSFPWGQDYMLDRLAEVGPRNLSKSAGYMQLGCIELEDHANRVFPTTIGANHWSPNSLGPRWHESFAAHFLQAWMEHLHKAFNQPLPPRYIQAACCASFAVEKEAILRRPKAFYEDMRTWILNSAMERYWLGAVLEFSWHMMFTNLAVLDPPKEQCLCDLYDICVSNSQ